MKSIHDNIPLRERLQTEKARLEVLWRDLDTVLRVDRLSTVEQDRLGYLLSYVEDAATAIDRLLAVNAGKKASDRT